MKLNPRHSKAGTGASMDTDDWLATMRSAWKAGIDRDEREQCAASTRRLVRVVTPEKESARQPLREALPVAVCVGACVLAGIALRHGATGPSAGASNEIRADETPESPAAVIAPAEPARSSPLSAPSSAAAPGASAAASAAAPASSMRPAPKPKNETEALPPLPRPTTSETAGASSWPPARLPGRRERLREILKVHGHRPPAPLPPRRAPKGHDRDL